MLARRLAPALAPLALTLLTGAARATCPDERDEILCEPHAAMFAPAVSGNAFFAHGLGAHYGAGLELVLFTWKSPVDTPGPSDGKIRLDAALLVSERDSSRVMVPFRLGAALSFEGTATRSFLVPYYAFDLGALYESELHTRLFADAGLGLYVLHTRTVSVDLEGTYQIPFSAVAELHGPKLQLTASFALW